MQKFKDILVMNWGKDKLNQVLKRQKVKFPEETIVSVNFDYNRVVGKARNFRNTPKGIICDVFLDDKKSDTIAPAFTVESISFEKGLSYPKGIELQSLSLVSNHADTKCEDNLK